MMRPSIHGGGGYPCYSFSLITMARVFSRFVHTIVHVGIRHRLIFMRCQPSDAPVCRMRVAGVAISRSVICRSLIRLPRQRGGWHGLRMAQCKT